MSTESKTRMTEGSIARRIILFAIPLFLGNLFQQLYNTADPLIVGNFLGSNALAAVSSSGNLIFLLSVLSTESPWVPGLLSPGIMEQKERQSAKVDTYNSGLWKRGRACTDGCRYSSGTEDSGFDGNTIGCASAVGYVFPYLFCGIAGICYV